jgi:hypothetical protein
VKVGNSLIPKLDDLDAVYDEITAREKVRMLVTIAEFFLPKQKEL